jgi:hypothetical protein
VTPEERDRLVELVHVWRDAAARHASEAQFSGEEERFLHEEAARIYRRCADELAGAIGR